MHWVGVIGCQPNDAMTAFLVQQLTAMHVITGRGAADEEVHVENAVESPLFSIPQSLIVIWVICSP